jgi:hypothetical protein
MRVRKTFESWSVFNSFWFHGLQFSYFNFQNPDVLGSAFVLTPFAEPVVFNRNKFLLTLRTGLGISWVTEIYDEETNPTNMFFCTHIAFSPYMALRMRYRLSSEWFLTLSGFYNHISNGGMKQPNYGMNFPTVALGAEYVRDPFTLERKAYTIEDRDKYKVWYYRLQAFGGLKVADETEEYPEVVAVVSAINLEAFRRLGMHYAIGFGAEYVNDRELKEEIKRAGLDVDNKRVALTASQDFHFGKVIFSQHFGIYVYAPYEAVDPVYQMYGLGVRLSRRILTGVFLKAHRHMADFMGLSLSYIGGKID